MANHTNHTNHTDTQTDLQCEAKYRGCCNNIKLITIPLPQKVQPRVAICQNCYYRELEYNSSLKANKGFRVLPDVPFEEAE